MEDLYVYHANGGNQTPPQCSRCSRSITDALYRVDDVVVCKSCSAEIDERAPEAR